MYNKAFKRSYQISDKTSKHSDWSSRNPVVLARLSALRKEFEADMLPPDQNNQKTAIFSEFQIQVFNDFSSAKILWEQFEKDAACFIYQQFSFCKTWYETVGNGRNKTPHIVVVQDLTGSTLMLVPLCLEKTRFGTTLSFIGDGMADYLCPLIQDDFATNLQPDQFPELWNKILATIDVKIDLVWLDRQTEEIIGITNPVSLLKNFDFSSSSHALNFPDAENWSRCARILRSGQTTKKIARRISKLAELGEIELVEISEKEKRQDHLQKLLAMKVQNLNDSGILHRMDKPEIALFYGALVADETIQNNLCQFELRCDGRVIASVLGFVHHDTFYYQISAFNKKDFGQYSPGLLLQYQLFDWSFSRGLKRFDMTVGDETYKEDWSNDTTGMVTVANIHSFMGALLYARRRAKLWATNKVKTSPKLRRLAMAIIRS